MKRILTTLSQKWPEYLLEIFVITIGILGAFGLNNWNDTQKEQKQEQQFLARLSDDLSKDIQEIESSLSSVERRKERAEYLLESVKNRSLVESAPHYFITSIEFAGYTNKPTISNHTFEEIKSSGRLSTISNLNIRNELADYYDAILDRDQYAFIGEDIQLQYINKHYGILSPAQQINMGNFSIDEEYNLEDALPVYTRFLENDEFIDWLPIVIQSKRRNILLRERQLEQVHKLRKLIDNELIK